MYLIRSVYMSRYWDNMNGLDENVELISFV